MYICFMQDKKRSLRLLKDSEVNKLKYFPLLIFGKCGEQHNHLSPVDNSFHELNFRLAKFAATAAYLERIRGVLHTSEDYRE